MPRYEGACDRVLGTMNEGHWDLCSYLDNQWVKIGRCLSTLDTSQKQKLAVRGATRECSQRWSFMRSFHRSIAKT